MAISKIIKIREYVQFAKGLWILVAGILLILCMVKYLL